MPKTTEVVNVKDHNTKTLLHLELYTSILLIYRIMVQNNHELSFPNIGLVYPTPLCVLHMKTFF